ncbi:MAG: VOC family protein [Planctomycetota bacterium]
MATDTNVKIVLDAGDLDATCGFWEQLLGFVTISTTLPDKPVETRVLRSEQYPGLVIEFRRCLPRPPQGVSPGSMRSLEFEVDDPIAVAARVTDPRWVSPQPEQGQTVDRLTLQDASGYHVTLVARHPAGSGDTASSHP